MKIVKYILSIPLIISALGGIFTGESLTGIIFLILGIILLPPISETLYKKVSYWKNNGVRYATYTGLFILASASIGKNTTKTPQSKKAVLIGYIKNNTSDKSLLNIKKLTDFSELFGIKNNTLIYPKKGHISEKYDSILNIHTLIFNPKFDFTNTEYSKYLKNDMVKGKLKDYSISIMVNENDSILAMRTVITYTKTGERLISNNEVPNFESFIDTVALYKLKQELALKQQALKERNYFNKIMGNDDFWKKYDPIVKKRIYKLIESKDCKGLQEEFNNVANMMERKQSSGIGADKELELTSFLNNKLRNIDCYGN